MKVMASNRLQHLLNLKLPQLNQQQRQGPKLRYKKRKAYLTATMKMM